MTFSYSGDPIASILDEIRFMVGDTDERGPLLQNEEINFALKKFEGEIYQTSIYLCRRILIAASSLTDSMSGLESIRGSQIQAQFKNRIVDLENEMAQASPPQLLAGGLNIHRKFSEHEGDNPRAIRGCVYEL